MSITHWQRADLQQGKTQVYPSHPQIHLHYFKIDDEAEEQGESETEICCHGCASALVVRYEFPPVDIILPSGESPKLKAEFTAFIERHQGCPDHGFMFLCPLERRFTRALDLRACVLKVDPYKG